MFKPVQLVPALPGWSAVFKKEDDSKALPVSCWVLMADSYQHRIEGIVQDIHSHQMVPASEMRSLDYLFSHYEFGDF